MDTFFFLPVLWILTRCGEPLVGVVAAFGAWKRLTVWTLSGTDVSSWTGPRAGHSPGGTGTQRLAVKPRGTGITFFLSWQILEPAWQRYSKSDDNFRRLRGFARYKDISVWSIYVLFTKRTWFAVISAFSSSLILI